MEKRRQGGMTLHMNRREFTFSLAALVSAPPESLSGTSQHTAEIQAGRLTEAEKTVLAEIGEQIVPRDDFPGAKDLGVHEFIDRLLAEAHPEWLIIYRSGLRSTDESSLAIFKKPFCELNFDPQTQLLERMSKGDLDLNEWGAFPPEEFFAMVRSHTIQGYYGHPRWGGNRDKQAWAMIGYEDWWV